MPDRKEREEVEALRRELEAARADGKAKESRWRLAAERLHRQVASSQAEVGELKEEVCASHALWALHR